MKLRNCLILLLGFTFAVFTTSCNKSSRNDAASDISTALFIKPLKLLTALGVDAYQIIPNDKIIVTKLKSKNPVLNNAVISFLKNNEDSIVISYRLNENNALLSVSKLKQTINYSYNNSVIKAPGSKETFVIYASLIATLADIRLLSDSRSQNGNVIQSRISFYDKVVAVKNQQNARTLDDEDNPTFDNPTDSAAYADAPKDEWFYINTGTFTVYGRTATDIAGGEYLYSDNIVSYNIRKSHAIAAMQGILDSWSYHYDQVVNSSLTANMVDCGCMVPGTDYSCICIQDFTARCTSTFFF
jgi:hypothetical protein